MRRRTTVLWASLSLGLLLTLHGTAAAQRLEISTRDIRATYPDLRVISGVNGEGPSAICPVTLEGSLHTRTIVKTAELLVGYVTRAILNRAACFLSGLSGAFILNGTELTPNSLPWHMRYESFSGTLPRVTAINLRIISLSFLVVTSLLSLSCLYRSTVAEPARVSANVDTSSGQITSLRFDLNANIPRSAGPGACLTVAHVSGDSSVSVLNSTALIFVRLI